MKIKYKKKTALTIIIVLSSLCLIDNVTFNEYFAYEMTNRENTTFKFDSRENWWWTDMSLLTETSTDESYVVSMTVDSTGDIHIVWRDQTDNLAGSGSDNDIFYKFYDSSLKTWSAIELVSSESTASSYDPIIGVDSEDNIHVIWEDSTNILSSGSDRDVFYKSRSPSGIWTTSALASPMSDTNVEHLDLEVDLETNNLHVTYYDFSDVLGAGSDADIFYIWYNSTTDTWSTTYLVTPESNGNSGASKIKVDPYSGDSHIIWYDMAEMLSSDADLDVYYRTFNHETSTFGTLRLVSDESTENSYTPSCELDSNGMFHIFWNDATELLDSGTDSDIFYKTFDTISKTWTDFEILSKESWEYSSRAFPIMDEEERMYVIWQDNSNIDGAGVDSDIFFRYRSHYDSVWSEIQVISTSSDDSSNEAKIVVDNKGYLTCIWQDQDNMLASGLDTDLFVRKFVGIPPSPLLSPISPNPSFDGNISLTWNGDYYDSSYSIYRDSSIFSSIAGLEPIAKVISENYNDKLNASGVFYYGIVAQNEYGVSDLSDVENVEFAEEKFFDFFKYMGILEILTLVGAIVLSQIIIAVLVYAIASSGSKSKGKGKKKK